MDIEKLMNDSDFCEVLGDVIRDEIENDDLHSRKIGEYALSAYKDNDANDMLVAICGWSMNTLIGMATERYEKYNKESD